MGRLILVFLALKHPLASHIVAKISRLTLRIHPKETLTTTHPALRHLRFPSRVRRSLIASPQDPLLLMAFKMLTMLVVD